LTEIQPDFAVIRYFLPRTGAHIVTIDDIVSLDRFHVHTSGKSRLNLGLGETSRVLEIFCNPFDAVESLMSTRDHDFIRLALLVVWAAAWATQASGETEPEQDTLAGEHWSFQPPNDPALPAVRDALWPRGAVDRFVLHRLETAGLTPAPAANRRTLIRRATFDLTGLPPSREEVDAFIADQSPEAFARVVDRLLASPRYGERWGRHWLDVARYADSNGLDENVAQANAWRYRDYVIEAFNQDKPYDDFIREQLAGDLLPCDDPLARNERLIATGFLSLGPKLLAEVDKTKMEMDIVDEQIDTVGKALLGLTLGCARCHDHKFDPITMSDYYALAGIFKSTQTMDSSTKLAKWHENPLFDEQFERAKAEHDALVAAEQAALDTLLADATAALQAKLGEGASLPEKPEESFPEQTCEQLKQRRAKIAELNKNVPEAPTAMGVQEGEAVDVAVHVRGSHLTLGDTVQRGLPARLSGDNTPKVDPTTSGRLALAEWLTEGDHPLTARVLVNRLWRWHFGRGLVSTTDNFGVMGEPPRDAELLDWLAIALVRNGWSIKHMHRLIMLSATYQMSSDYDAASVELDPGNQQHWRSRIRRLAAEELRDALLAVSGQLDETRGGPCLAVKNREFIFDHTSKDETSYESLRRSVYLPVIRNHLCDSFTLFDYTDASISNGDRNTSTVASQALYLMNSPFMEEAATRLADRVLAVDVESDAARIRWLYETVIGRSPAADEIVRIETYLGRFEELAAGNQSEFPPPAWRLVCQTLLMSNEFSYVR